MNEIGQLVAQYGLVPAIMIVLMYLLIIWYQKHAEKKRIEAEAKKEQEKIAAEAKANAEREQRENERDLKILSMFKEAMIESVHPKHTVEEQEEGRRINGLIDHELGCLVEKGSTRAYLFSFHNGGSDMIGRGYLKMSLTDECVRPGCTPIMQQYQNIPRGLFPKLYNVLENAEYYDVTDVELIENEDPMTYSFLKEHGAASAFFRPIKRSDGLMLGFVGTEFDHAITEHEELATARRRIDAKANRIIGALLGSADEKDDNNPLIN